MYTCRYVDMYIYMKVLRKRSIRLPLFSLIATSPPVHTVD